MGTEPAAAQTAAPETAPSASLGDVVVQNDERARALVKAHLFGVGTDETTGAPEGASKAYTDEELFGTAVSRVILPPYDPLTLSRLVEQSSELVQCVQAYRDNIEGFGYRLVPRVRLDDPEVSDEVKAAVREERAALTNFLVAIGGTRSLTSIRKDTREEVEVGGNGYWEIVRNKAGRQVLWNPVPAWSVRLTPQDPDWTPSTVRYVVVDAAGNYTIEDRIVYRRFRRYVQGEILTVAADGSTTRGRSLRWFKEYGDPRVIDCRTGDPVPADQAQNYKDTGKPFPEEFRASEILHWRVYSPRSAYGIPRWVGNLVSVLGVRRAEEVNLSTLTNNNIPSMVISVSNGRLTDGTIKRIKQFVDTQIRGSSNYSQFLLLEGESPFDQMGDESGQIRIDIKPLTREQHTDALFVKYMEGGKDSIRRSFRLPELFVGVASALNRATATEARKLADEQVFAPARADSDYQINALLVDAGFVYHEFRSQSPNVTDNPSLIAMMAAAERTGGLTPRIARKIVEEVFQGATVGVPGVGTGGAFDADVPFSLTMAEAVQNKADPTEINQQVAPVQGAVEPDIRKEHRAAVVRDLLDLGDRLGDEVRRLLRTGQLGPDVDAAAQGDRPPEE